MSVPPPPGCWCVTKNIVGTAALVVVITYVTKWLIYEQRVDTFESYRMDKEFGDTLPFVLLALAAVWMLHCLWVGCCISGMPKFCRCCCCTRRQNGRGHNSPYQNLPTTADDARAHYDRQGEFELVDLD
jgi:hypothetical protein